MNSNEKTEKHKINEAVKRVLGFKTNAELATALNMSPQAYSHRMNLGKLPLNEISFLLKDRGIDDSFLFEDSMRIEKENSFSQIRDLQEQLIQSKDETIELLRSQIEEKEERIKGLQNQNDLLKSQIGNLLELIQEKKSTPERGRAFNVLMSLFIQESEADEDDARRELQHHNISLAEEDFRGILAVAKEMADEWWEEEL
jgi:hypothetical protein